MAKRKKKTKRTTIKTKIKSGEESRVWQGIRSYMRHYKWKFNLTREFKVVARKYKLRYGVDWKTDPELRPCTNVIVEPWSHPATSETMELYSTAPGVKNLSFSVVNKVERVSTLPLTFIYDTKKLGYNVWLNGEHVDYLDSVFLRSTTGVFERICSRCANDPEEIFKRIIDRRIDHTFSVVSFADPNYK